MSLAPLLPVASPALAGALVLVPGGAGAGRLGLAGAAATLAAALALLPAGLAGPGLAFRPGGAFGIALLADGAGLLLAVVAAAVALAALAPAARAEAAPPAALALLLLAGVNGALLTGALFSLFVFGELALIAAAGLMAGRGGAHVAAHLAGALLALAAIATLHAVTGTLDLADLARRAGQVPAEDAAYLRLGGALLALALAARALLLPALAWRSRAPAVLLLLPPLGAVGGLLRVVAALQPSGLAAMIAPGLAAAGGAALLAGGLAGWARPRRAAGGAALFSLGLAVLTLSFGTPVAVAATLFHLGQALPAAALLFLLAGRDRPPAWLMLGAALTLAGLPPLSGFPARILAMQAMAEAPWAVVLVLAATLALIAGLARAASRPGPDAPRRGAGAVPVALLAGLVASTPAAGPIERLCARAAAQLAAGGAP